jgi:hypothetical protein
MGRFEYRAKAPTVENDLSSSKYGPKNFVYFEFSVIVIEGPNSINWLFINNKMEDL